MDSVVLIPAAGRGSRLGSSLPKALVPVNGTPMLEHLLRLYGAVADRFIVIGAPGFEQLAAPQIRGPSRKVEFAVQAEPTGMLDAILVPHARIAELRPRRIWITWCDQIAVHPATIAALDAASTAVPAPALALPTMRRSDPYIHFDRDADGRIVGVRQRREADGMPQTGESDVGLFNLSLDTYVDLLPRFADEVVPAAGTAERNFLPFIPWLNARAAVATIPATTAMECVGINTPAELERVAEYLRSSAVPAGSDA